LGFVAVVAEGAVVELLWEDGGLFAEAAYFCTVGVVLRRVEQVCEAFVEIGVEEEWEDYEQEVPQLPPQHLPHLIAKGRVGLTLREDHLQPKHPMEQRWVAVLREEEEKIENREGFYQGGYKLLYFCDLLFGNDGATQVV